MKKPNLAMVLAGVALVTPATAFAQQWVPGSEITGQTVQVQTNGITNNVYFGPGGQATITTPGGNVANASWTNNNGQLCLHTALARECWAYQAPFQAGQPVTLLSSCNSSSQWLANSINQLPPPPPVQQSAGERG